MVGGPDGDVLGSAQGDSSRGDPASLWELGAFSDLIHIYHFGWLALALVPA